MTRKNYFSISEIAKELSEIVKEFNVKKSQIRSYEKKRPLPTRNNKLKHRIYNQHDRARLEVIFNLKHIDYSLSQISELMGILDKNLDKMEQFRKSLNCGERNFDELERRIQEIEFPDKSSVRQEIKMKHESVEKLKNIEPYKTATKKNLKRKQIRIIPVYVGLPLMLIIAGCFFYHGGKAIKLAQTKPSKTEVSPVCRYPLPSDDTGKLQNVASQSSKIFESTLQTPGEDNFIENSKQLFNKKPIIANLETVISTTNMGETGRSDSENIAIKYKQTDKKMSVSADVAERKTSAPQNRIQPGIYKTYVHYTSKNHEKLMERLCVFLTQNGFRIEGIQKVNYHHRDIRYFHDEDKEAALVLQKYFTEFITPSTDIKNNTIKIINLSSKFPKAKKKTLELWVNI